jgi:hypothetical protein
MIARLAARVVATLAVLVALPGVTFAQAQAPRERPMDPLFGGNALNPAVTETLDANLSVAGGTDDNVGLALGTDDGRVGLGASFASLDGGLTYSTRRRRSEFGASGSVSVRRLFGQGVRTSEAPSYSGGLGLALQTSQRTRFRVDQSVSWSPYYDFGLLMDLQESPLGAAAATRADNAAVEARTLRTATEAAFEQELSERLSYRLEYRLQQVDVARGQFTDAGALVQHKAAARLMKAMTANTTLRLGYGFESAPDAVIFGSREIDRSLRAGNNHSIDLGVDFARPLTLGRRTTLLFGIGSAISSSRGPLQGAVDSTGTFVDKPTTDIGLIGRVRLDQVVGGGWTVAAGFERSADYVEVLNSTVFSDAIGLDVTGLISRRVEVVSSVDYGRTNGQYALGGDHFYTGRANFMVRAAATQLLALFGEFSYYSYQFDEQFPLPEGFSSALKRRSVRIGATLWLPLLLR